MSINLFRWALLMPLRVLGLHMQHVAQFISLGIDHVAARAWLGVAVVVELVAHNVAWRTSTQSRHAREESRGQFLLQRILFCNGVGRCVSRTHRAFHGCGPTRVTPIARQN